jgi:uncharacterized protein YneF (UPF0154 family)
MDSTIAILGILAVVVALCGFVFLPGWLRKRRMDKELQNRRCWKPPPEPPK